MLTRSILTSVAQDRSRRSRLRLPKASAVLAWAVWQRHHSALMVARMEQMRAEQLRRYRARPGPWL